MKPIQLLLVGGALVSLVVYLRFLRSSLRDRILVAGGMIAFIVAVAMPDLTQRAADLVGVGRGTDLTLYVFILLGTFVGLMLYSKVVRLHRDLTVVVRQLALLRAQDVSEEPATKSPPNA